MTIEGFGESTVGGAGGSVLTVTNLNNSGAGSLRTALTTAGARIVRFSVAGNITLTSQIEITNDNITIEGDTAPLGGICIRNDEALEDPPIRISCSEVIIQHIRFRPGPSDTLANAHRALAIGEGDNIVLDHCSFSWATDINLSFFSNSANGISNVSIQYCILAWGCDDSTHEDEGSPGVPEPHSMNLRLGGSSTNDIEDITVHHCILAHGRDRNPLVDMTGGVLDFVNNVTWDNGPNVALQMDDDRWEAAGDPEINAVKNYWAGTNSARQYFVRSSTDAAEFYIEGNYSPFHTDPEDADELTGILDPSDHGEAVGSRHTAPTLSSETEVFTARTDVLANAGAQPRDSVDDRVVRNVTNLVEQIIDDPIEVHDWPDLTRGGGLSEPTYVMTDNSASGLEPAFQVGFGDEMFALPAQDIGVGQTYETGADIKAKLLTEWAHLSGGETNKLHFQVVGTTVQVCTGTALPGYS